MNTKQRRKTIASTAHHRKRTRATATTDIAHGHESKQETAFTSSGRHVVPSSDRYVDWLSRRLVTSSAIEREPETTHEYEAAAKLKNRTRIRDSAENVCEKTAAAEITHKHKSAQKTNVNTVHHRKRTRADRARRKPRTNTQPSRNRYRQNGSIIAEIARE